MEVGFLKLGWFAPQEISSRWHLNKPYCLMKHGKIWKRHRTLCISGMPIATGIATLLNPILHQAIVSIHSPVNLLKLRLFPTPTDHPIHRLIKPSPNPWIIAQVSHLTVAVEGKGDRGKSRFGGSVVAEIQWYSCGGQECEGCSGGIELRRSRLQRFE